MKCKVHNNAKYEGLNPLAEDLYKFAHKRFGFTKPVLIVFESSMENSGKVFAPTGHYDPQSSKIVIFVDQRHPKDILRSLAHELVHHKQNCAGHFDGSTNTNPGYAQRDQHMREMEGDAYRTGNVMLFRDWEDNYKKGGNLMNENKERVEEKKKLTPEQEKYFGKGEKKEEEECEGEHCPEKEESEETVEEEQKTSDKQWYQSQLHEALLKKFKIKK